MRHVLFVCSQNHCRSVTAELVFRNYHPEIWVRSCGIDSSATVPFSTALGMWADLIICFEQMHVKAVKDEIGDLHDDDNIVCLGIPDSYNAMDPELVAMLKARVPEFLR